jgi:hypothetical protein
MPSACRSARSAWWSPPRSWLCRRADPAGAAG